MKKIITILCLLVATVLHATNYYVSNTGSDAANGLTTGTAWQTVAKVNSSTFVAGDSVLFEKGGIWRETLTMPSSGSSGNHIITGSYGTGNKPSINANDVVTSWSSESLNGIDFIATKTPLSYWYFEDASSPSLDGTANDNDIPWVGGGNAAQTSTHIQGTFALNPGSVTGGASLAFGSVSANFPGKAATTDFTIGCWVKVKASWSIYTNFFAFTNGSSQGWALSTSFTNKIRFRVWGSSDRTLESDDALNDGNWHHVVCRWRGSTDDEVALFIDGEKQESATSITSLDLVTASALVIQRGDLDAIDEAWVYPTALSDGEIYSVYTYGLNGLRTTATVYYNTETISDNNPFTVIDNGQLLNNVDVLVALKTGTWYYDTSAQRTYVYTNPSGRTVELGKRANAINTNSKNYLTFTGLDLQGGNSKSGTFRIVGSDDVTLTASDVHNCFTAVNDASGDDNILIDGNHIYTGYGFGFVSFNLMSAQNCIIRNNEINDWGNLLSAQIVGSDNPCGIFAQMLEITIESNTIYNIALQYYVLRQGIYIAHTFGIIRYNYIYDCGHSGVKISTGSDNTEVYMNTIYHCSAGVNVVGSVGVKVNNNTITGADNRSRPGFNGYAIYIFPDLTDPLVNSSITQLENNIIINNLWTGLPLRQIFSENDIRCSISGSDYNIIWSATGNSGDQIEVAGVGYTFAEWQATGQDAHSLNVNPLLVNEGVDFNLQSGSPAINAGTNLGFTRDKAGHPVSNPPDIGCLEYTAAIPKRGRKAIR